MCWQQGNQLMVLSGMTALTSLEVLIVEGNQIVKLANLRNCTALVDVQASRNRIRKVEELDVRGAGVLRAV
jgi:Leucine-rich repeat (LRR) protein